MLSVVVTISDLRQALIQLLSLVGQMISRNSWIVGEDIRLLPAKYGRQKLESGDEVDVVRVQ